MSTQGNRTPRDAQQIYINTVIDSVHHLISQNSCYIRLNSLGFGVLRMLRFIYQ